MHVLSNGNIALSFELEPEVYAALMAACARDGLNRSTVAGIGILTYNVISAAAAKAGRPLKDAPVSGEDDDLDLSALIESLAAKMAEVPLKDATAAERAK